MAAATHVPLPDPARIPSPLSNCRAVANQSASKMPTPHARGSDRQSTIKNLRRFLQPPTIHRCQSFPCECNPPAPSQPDRPIPSPRAGRRERSIGLSRRRFPPNPRRVRARAVHLNIWPLKWIDVYWETCMMNVPSPKTEHYAGNCLSRSIRGKGGATSGALAGAASGRGPWRHFAW